MSGSEGARATRRRFVIAARPDQLEPNEPGFALEREEGEGRTQRYSMRAYATGRPEGERY